MSMFLDIHPIQSVPPSCINRDDTGSPKSATFGGVLRHRVSSQSWKASSRRVFPELLNADDLGERSKLHPRRIADTIVDRRPDISAEDALKATADAFAKASAGKKDEKIKVSTSGDNAGETGYLLFLARAEIEALTELAIRIADGEKVAPKDAKESLLGKSAVDLALFGRMVADSPTLGVDAACQVAHALSVHEVIAEYDYFTGVDDNGDGHASAMIGVNEFMSSTLYRYATIDVDRLVNNLGDREAAAKAVEAFVTAYLTSMPTGKQNSYANRTLPDFVLAEVRRDQPLSLVNAFETPVANTGNATGDAALALAGYAVDTNDTFGTAPQSSVYLSTKRASSDELVSVLDGRSQKVSLPEMATALGDAVRADVDQNQ